MRPQKAINIINTGFRLYLKNNNFEPLFSRHFKKAVIVCFNNHIRKNKRVQRILDKLDLFGIKYSSVYRNEITKLDLSFKIDTIDNVSDPLYARPVSYLHYISDRWNSPERLRFLFNVINTFTPQELSEIDNVYKNKDIPVESPKIKSDETYEDPFWFDVKDLTESQLIQLSYIKKSKGFGKIFKSKMYHRRDYSMIYYNLELITHHFKCVEFNSNKWIWFMNTTSRFIDIK
jgi:hypothetical protein